MAQRELEELEVDRAELEQLRQELSNYFCEDDTTFKLEECLKIFNTFCEKFAKAIEVRWEAQSSIRGVKVLKSRNSTRDQSSFC